MFAPQPFDSSRPGLWRPSRLHPTGETGPTRGQARGRRVRRTSHGFYLPSHIDGDRAEQRIAEASVVVPPGSAITGWAALRSRGARWFDGLDAWGRRRPVVVCTSTHDIRPQPGIVPSGEGLKGRLVEVVDGLPVTSVAYAVSHEMRHAPTREAAITVLEMAAYDDLVSVSEMQAFLTPGQNGWTGVPRARWAADRAEENAWSPPECEMRFAWLVDGRPRAVLANRPVFSLEGRHIGTPDLIDPETGVVGEYAGAVHLEGRQWADDLGRESELRSHGLVVVTMIGADRASPRAFQRRLESAYRYAEQQAPSQRRWTLQQPAWWVPTHTVAMRRALTPAQQARFLRYRNPAA